MKINCLACGHHVALDDAYDDYEGQIKCFACGAILAIKAGQPQVGEFCEDGTAALGRRGFRANALEVISKPSVHPSPFDKLRRLRANGESLENSGILPFVLSRSKHDQGF